MNLTTVLTFILAMVLFVAGLLLMGYAFDTPGLGMLLFSAGLIAMFVGVAIPVVFARNVTRKSS